MSTRDSAIDVDSWEPEIQLVGIAIPSHRLPKLQRREPERQQEVQRKNTLRPNKRKVQADIIDLSHEEEIGKRNGQIARKRQKASTSSTPSAQGPSRWKSQEATYVCDSDEELALMTASPAINDVAPDYELDDIPIASFHQEQPGPDESDDSEDDWANCYEGYNIIQGRSWKPSAVPLTEPPDSMDDLVDELNNLTVVEEPVQVGYNRMHKHLQLPHLELPVGGGYRPYPWANVSRPGYRPSGHGPAFYAGTRRLQMTGRRMQALPREIGMVSGLEYLPHVTRICKAPGSVNRILQRRGVIVACSAVPGGGSEPEGEDLPSSNVDGALTLWRDGQVHKLHSHRSKWNNRDKWCTVNDIQWDFSDPEQRIFASSGHDGFVRLWDVDDVFDNAVLEDGELHGGHDGVIGQGQSCRCINRTNHRHKCRAEHPFNGAIPFDIAFRPGNGELAVACNDGSLVVLLQPQENAHYCKEEFAPGHSTGAITWGRGPTSSTIFASSESANTDSGVHIAWDIAKPGRQIQKFIASKKESGDAMTINPSGKTLALFTTDSNAMHRVRLYDVGRKNCQTPIETIELEPFEETCNESCEVTRAIYSTDGIYLAVARSDDSCHLYDSRYLTRPVHQFKHKGESKASVAADTYGITEVQFVDSLLGSRTCLVTGGTDGCVRLWDLFKPDDDPTNGKIIAQSDYNVGTFAIGHPADGVQDLLLGDCGGEVRMFKRGRADH